MPKVPSGLPPVPVPEDNPITAEKVELGKLLYFDNRVSKDGTVSGKYPIIETPASPK